MTARFTLLTGVLAAALALSGVAEAQSLKDARARESSVAALEREATYTRKVCGADIRAEIDWASAGDWQAGLLIGECDKALGALEAACRAGDKRARAVSHFVCAGDGAGAELSGRRLRYGAAPDLNAFGETRAAISGE